MTEQEIIQYLKDNRRNGVAYGFMPDEVQDWVEIHPSTWFSAFFSVSGKTSWKRIGGKNVEFDRIDIIMLPSDFKLPSENTSENGEWVEIELKDGKFYDIQQGVFYSWYQWSKIMSVHPSFTHFGGYYYGIELIPRWYMSECVAPTDCNGSIYTSYADGNKNIKPLTPKKIRFWRELK